MLNLHGWSHVIEEGEICIFDAQKDDFVLASLASHCGTGPYAPYVEHDGQVCKVGGGESPQEMRC
jgi:carbonic anhydrase